MAFVIVKTAVGHEKAVAKELAKIDEVSEVYLLTGEYDILVDAKDPSTVIDLIAEKLRKVGGIQETRTIFTEKIK
ncbi:MAG: Lrp/AsnC ligand binding domain-containing protein [Methanocellales archaeon]|nr:Lrp/AsnC ligand binding domain-containing protein [Methanocellales archaeon]MDI6902913.1 Lrp/AsnC ligand binding domain-containing protein [Methanocellales archaeon]